MKRCALAAIRLYQRHISPRKGFRCAYRAHTGRCGCSALGYRAIRWRGAWRGLGVLRLRLRKCGVAHRRFGSMQMAPGIAAWARPQRGFCDCACDVPSLDCLPDLGCGGGSSWLSDGASWLCDCADCGCDWPRSKKDDGDDKHVYIPPSRRGGFGSR